MGFSNIMSAIVTALPAIGATAVGGPVAGLAVASGTGAGIISGRRAERRRNRPRPGLEAMPAFTGAVDTGGARGSFTGQRGAANKTSETSFPIGGNVSFGTTATQIGWIIAAVAAFIVMVGLALWAGLRKPRGRRRRR